MNNFQTVTSVTGNTIMMEDQMWFWKKMVTNLKTETPPITIYLSQNFPIYVLKSKCPIPQARIFNHCKLFLPSNNMIKSFNVLCEAESNKLNEQYAR